MMTSFVANSLRAQTRGPRACVPPDAPVHQYMPQLCPCQLGVPARAERETRDRAAMTPTPFRHTSMCSCHLVTLPKSYARVGHWGAIGYALCPVRRVIHTHTHPQPTVPVSPSLNSPLGQQLLHASHVERLIPEVHLCVQPLSKGRQQALQVASISAMTLCPGMPNQGDPTTSKLVANDVPFVGGDYSKPFWHLPQP